jgi:hypothetical protein
MTTQRIHLPLRRPDGHTTRFIATLADEGWDVYAELDDAVVMNKHCADWRRVERLRALVQARLDEAVEADSPTV